MSHPDQVKAHIEDSVDLYADIANGTLPAVSVVKPSGYMDGHPASSKLNLFEGFMQKIVDDVKASPYWQNTAIFITFDEGGGYYDSGYVQPLDFFGDGTRIPLLVVSPLATGATSRTNMRTMSPSSNSSRGTGDRHGHQPQPGQLPEPDRRAVQPYVPTNSPAISDLFDLFDFKYR